MRSVNNTQESFIQNFFRLESSGGIILIFAAVLAFVCANTPLESYYNLFIDIPIEIRISTFEVEKPLLLWINDGLMVIFFFLISLELKREILEGELSVKRNIILPGLGAIGGMAVPALIYTYFNFSDPMAMKGWAIPTVTSLPFALGVLSLLGPKVPVNIKVFLKSIAIFSDIGAILIVAFVYTAHISLTSILAVACCIPILSWMNIRHYESKSFYLTVGAVMWAAMLKSGVHATLTGVIMAMFVPLTSQIKGNPSPLKSLGHDLRPVVTFFVLPIFAFANAGINISYVGTEHLLHDVPLGIMFGLFAGKQVGVFGSCWLAVKFKLTSLPKGMSWSAMYGTAALCGIGFTMSLFVGSLAFEETGVNLIFDERLGIVIGSLASGIVGYIILRQSLRSHKQLENSTP